jgi:hypothetical protein
MTPEMNDKLLVRELVERWAVWRDAGDWDRFATVWHPDGVMMATWFQGPFATSSASPGKAGTRA